LSTPSTISRVRRAASAVHALGSESHSMAESIDEQRGAKKVMQKGRNESESCARLGDSGHRTI
jgi:hypothetical protein